jgi:tRNA 2-selenouridine synthase
VGTVYKQVSSFDARKQGAALVSRNIAGHLESHFSKKGKNYRPLFYCWRGGQRSGSMATILSSIGWDVSVVEGGYKAYRCEVLRVFEDACPGLQLTVLNGYTGAGKTYLLQVMAEAGHQILDLEGMAQHKGSVFGGDPENPQPQQKRFESLVYEKLVSFDLERPVYVEAESAKIGKLNLPNPLWQKMKEAPIIEIFSPLEERARHIINDYEDWIGDETRIEMTLDRLTGFHSLETIGKWKELAREKEWQALVEGLLEEHYDKRYTVGGTGHFNVPERRVDLPNHAKETLEQAVGEVVAR